MENTVAENSIQTSQIVAPSSKMSYEEFLREYDGQYAEYVDGEVIKDMSVTKTHSKINLFLSSILQLYVESKRAGQLFGEPYQMRLTFGDEIKGREPDIFFVADENAHRLQEKYCDGAADLVVEIISPESRVRDRGDKFYEYEAAGVKEYWLIDGERKQAEFYRLNEDGIFEFVPTTDGKFESRVIKGLWINTNWLWQEDLPGLMDVLKEWKLV